MAERKRKKKPLFTEPQVKMLIDAVKRQLKSFKDEGLGQEELAAALGLTQPSLSNLIRNKWKPGLTTAKAIAQREGYAKLEDMIGPIAEAPDSTRHTSGTVFAVRFPALETCIQFYTGRKEWSPWTVAAARAGFFGESDLPAPEWAERLDALEAALLTARKKKSSA